MRGGSAMIDAPEGVLQALLKVCTLLSPTKPVEPVRMKLFISARSNCWKFRKLVVLVVDGISLVSVLP